MPQQARIPTATTVASILMLNKLNRRVFAVFNYVILAWIICAFLAAIAVAFHKHNLYHLVEGVVEWVTFLFAVVAIVSIYITRFLHNRLVPVIEKFDHLLKVDGCSPTEAAARMAVQKKTIITKPAIDIK